MTPTGNKQNNNPSVYDDYYGSEYEKFFRILDTRRRFIKESIMSWGGEMNNVLDLGCGWGELFNYLDKIYYKDNYPAYTFKGTGIDYCGKTILKNIDRNPLYTWQYHNLENELKIDDESFDFVFCGETIEHLSNPAICLSEIYRVTKKGGLIIITVPLNDRNDAPEHMHYFSEIDLIKFVPGELISYNLYEKAQQCAAWVKN